MTASFYNVSDDRNVFPKSLGTALFTVSNGIIKDDCSIENPVLVLDYNLNIKNCNYFYLDDYARYYFITDITTSQRRMFVTGEVDVLHTFRNDILNLDAYIARCSDSTKSNMLLPDNFVPVQVDRVIREVGENCTDMNNFEPIDGNEVDRGSWVLLVNGGNVAPS